jgi:hypothetical protein
MENEIATVCKKVYEGNNPNSLAAWIYTDISPTQNGRILLNDKFEDFEWEQNKSNQNIVGFSNKGSGIGKGFSFYFARYAYNDNYKHRDSSLSTSTGGYPGLLASIYTDFLNKYINSTQLSNKLNPKNRILMVIDDKQNDSKITIISAYYTNKKELLNLYVANFAEKLIIKDEQQSGRFRENTDIIRKKIKKVIMDKIKKSIIEGTKEFEQLLKCHN